MLGPEDLEDCLSQATLELLSHVRNGGAFASELHAANALELRFCSRVRDRRRAISGRSPIEAALHDAVVFDCSAADAIPVADRLADVERQVALREELRRIRLLVDALTGDQRIALACELNRDGSVRELCDRLGWSEAKYRKLAQRARARLRRLIAVDGEGNERDAARVSHIVRAVEAGNREHRL